MTSNSAAGPSSSPEETPNWLELPEEITAAILHKVGAIEIIDSAEKVCTTWRRICKDPAMWKVIDMNGWEAEYDLRHAFDGWDTDYSIEKMTKHAVNRSCGELIDISLQCCGTDDLLDHISQCSNKLKHLRFMNCHNITGSGLTHALKSLPNLETLHLFYTSINPEDIEAIGQNCPQLKSFKMKTKFRRSHIMFKCDVDALAVANNMPGLHHLQLIGSKMTDDGLRAILKNCPHLESLDLRRCTNLKLSGNLGKMCKDVIKYFKHPNDWSGDCWSSSETYDSDEDSDGFDFEHLCLSAHCDIDDFSDEFNDEVSFFGEDIYDGDIYDEYDLL